MKVRSGQKAKTGSKWTEKFNLNGMKVGKKEKRLKKPFFFAELKNEIQGNYQFDEPSSEASVSSSLPLSLLIKVVIVAISSLNHSISTCTAPGSISIKVSPFRKIISLSYYTMQSAKCQIIFLRFFEQKLRPTVVFGFTLNWKSAECFWKSRERFLSRIRSAVMPGTENMLARQRERCSAYSQAAQRILRRRCSAYFAENAGFTVGTLRAY